MLGLKRESSLSQPSPRASASIRTAAQPSAACLCLLISSNFSERQLSPAEELRSQKQLRWSLSSPSHGGSASGRSIRTNGRGKKDRK